MSHHHGGGRGKVQKVMIQPINVLFKQFQTKVRVQIWLYGKSNLRIEGIILGFDEFMNLVMDEATEINVKSQTTKPIGRILLRGDNITLIQNVQ